MILDEKIVLLFFVKFRIFNWALKLDVLYVMMKYTGFQTIINRDGAN